MAGEQEWLIFSADVCRGGMHIEPKECLHNKQHLCVLLSIAEYCTIILLFTGLLSATLIKQCQFYLFTNIYVFDHLYRDD